jgi:hypothetical protein
VRKKCHVLFEWPLKRILIKQWPPDSEFIEFEFSPENHHFWRIRVLAKLTLFDNGSDSLNSSTFANLVCSDSPDLPTFAKPFCEDSPDSRKASLASLANLASVG